MIEVEKKEDNTYTFKNGSEVLVEFGVEVIYKD